MIRLESVWKGFLPSRTPVLRGLSLTLQRGEAVIITGPSGSGKSIINQLLLGLLPPDSGEIWIADRNLAKLRDNSIPYVRRNMGTMVQGGSGTPNRGLVNRWTVAENIGLPLEVLGLHRAEVRY